MKFEGRIENRFRHYLYRIEDEEGDPWYVGVTCDPAARARDHGRASSKPYVDRRIREHGVGKFTMIFYGGSNSHARICDREIKEMKRLGTYRPAFPDNPNACNLKQCHASFVHDLSDEKRKEHNAKIGNSIREYHLKLRAENPIRFAGEEFLETRKAADFAKVSIARMQFWIREGIEDYPPEYLSPNRGGRPSGSKSRYRQQGTPVTWDDIEYPSYKAASEGSGTPLETLKRWAKRGFNRLPTLEERKEFRKNQIREMPTQWEDTLYPSVKKAAAAAGTSTAIMSIWRRKGITSFPPGFKPRPFRPRKRKAAELCEAP